MLLNNGQYLSRPMLNHGLVFRLYKPPTLVLPWHIPVIDLNIKVPDNLGNSL